MKYSLVRKGEEEEATPGVQIVSPPKQQHSLTVPQTCIILANRLQNLILSLSLSFVLSLSGQILKLQKLFNLPPSLPGFQKQPEVCSVPGSSHHLFYIVSAYFQSL